MPELPDTVVRGRFGLVSAAARENLGAAIDMILVHNEKEVRGPQPRASLNRAVVVTAIGAWDRFVADTRHAFTSTDSRWGSGLDSSNFGDLYARRSAELLTEAGATEPFFWQRLRLVAATNWSGVRMRGMETLTGDHPGQRSGLTFSQHLNQWVTVRNALAHGSIRELLRLVNAPPERTDPRIRAAYTSISGERYRLWESNAVGTASQHGEERLGGATIQSGCARGCLALIIQTIDWLIVDICRANGRAWDSEDLRLPASWFRRKLPSRFRSTTPDGHVHWTLWGGPELYRRMD
jgi:hypothetical protein